MNTRRIACICTMLLFILSLAGCGGNGGTNENGGSAPQTIIGVAAAGAPLSGTVYLKDSSVPARERSVPIAADGAFSFGVDGLTPPFLIKAVGTANGKSQTLYSFAATAGVANVNPLSHLALVEANGSDTLEELYGSPDSTKMQAVMHALPSSVVKVQTVLQPTLAKFGAATVNFISDPFVANHQGLDLLLDMADISVRSGTVIVIDKPANNTLQWPLGSFMTGSKDVIAASPTVVGGSVVAWPGMQSVEPNGTVNLTAIVVGATNQQVDWSVVEENGGTVTSSGVYTAPATAGTYHVKATSATDTTKSATLIVVVRGVNSLRIASSGAGVFTVQASTWPVLQGSI